MIYSNTDIYCRAQHDYAAERQKRLDKIQDLEDKVKNLEAQEQTMTFASNPD